jgi:hypothetical protein
MYATKIKILHLSIKNNKFIKVKLLMINGGHIGSNILFHFKRKFQQ